MKIENYSNGPWPIGKDAFGVELKVGDRIIACHNNKFPFVKGTIVKLGKAQATYFADGYGDYKFHTDYAHVAKI